MDVFVESTGKHEALQARETSSNRMEAPRELRMLTTHREPRSGVCVVCFHSVLHCAASKRSLSNC